MNILLARMWRETAATWRKFMRRHAMLWREDRCHTFHRTTYNLTQALNCRDSAARALAKAEALEREAAA